MNEPIQGAKKQRRPSGLLGLLLAGVALLAGCVSPNAAKQVQKFSSAVALTASNSAQAYQLVEKTYFNAQLSQVTTACFDGTNINLKPYETNQFKVFWQTNQLQVRLDVLSALTAYAAHLSTLMGNPALSNLDTDTTKFDEALTNLNQDLVTATIISSNTFTASEFQAFTTGVNVIGRWVITQKEQKEAKLAIAAMQKYLPRICDVLETDLGYLRAELDKDYKTTLESADMFFRHNDVYLNPFQRRAELEHLVALSKAKQTADAALDGTQASLESLADAHKHLIEAFHKDTSKLSSLISEVSGEAQRAAAYYNSLRTNN